MKMSIEEKLNMCNLRLELTLERCDKLVEEMKSQGKLKRKRGRKPGKPKATKNVGNLNLNKKIKAPKVCWGCLEEGNLKNMHTPQYYDGFKEVYAHMVEYCFSLKVNKKDRINYICDNCIQKLRETLRFKKQITIAQDYLNQITGGASSTRATYTGQEKISDVDVKNKELHSSNSIFGSSQVDNSLLANPLQKKPLQFKLAPAIQGSSQNILIVKRKPTLSPVYIFNPNKATSQLITVKNRAKQMQKKFIIVQQRPRESTGNKAITSVQSTHSDNKDAPTNNNIVHEIEDSSDDEVQIVDSTPPTSVPERDPPENGAHTYSFDNTREQCYFGEEDNNESEYITSTTCEPLDG